MFQHHPPADSGESAQLGEFVRERRKRLELSQRELANRTGLSNGFISRLEDGQFKEVSQRVLRQLADTLEVDPEDLYAVSGYTTPQSLPGFAAYLRAKYEMSEEVARELTEFFDRLASRHGVIERPRNQKLSDDHESSEEPNQ